MSVSNKWARIEELCVLKNAFSLMEMMVVLLIVAILAAATAPMVTKKMARNAGSGDSPWVYTGLSNSIAYNMNGSNSTAIIGATQYRQGTNGPANPRLVLAGDTNHPGLVFADSNGNFTLQMKFDSDTIALNDADVGQKSVAMGMEQETTNAPSYIVALGNGTQTSADYSVTVGQGANVATREGIAIGYRAQATNGNDARYSAIAIGSSASATSDRAIAIGRAAIASNVYAIAIGSNPELATDTFNTTASGSGAIAIGRSASANAAGSVALGEDATVGAGHTNSVAIGRNATTTQPDQIALGGPNTTVFIRGNLVVGRHALLNSREDGQTMVRRSNEGHEVYLIRSAETGNSADNLRRYPTDASTTAQTLFNNYVSDRRLKNVGEAYTAGLDELKKLDFFHYTFKKDEAKTPHVGVMAQDLQKVFPDAVTEGDDGYLRIRMEDMFYAVINAVKELDKKITQIVENVTSLSKKVDEQEKIIAEQQKLIEELQAQNANIEKRLAKVEKKSKKVAE